MPRASHPAIDVLGRYHEYLERFAGELGAVEVGAFAKFGGRLIKKLTLEEFTRAFLEYSDISDRYYDSLDRGDTIDNMVVRILREKAANLVVKPPV